MSLFKSLAAIRFTFILGISFVVYYSFVIVYESFDENISNLSQNFDHAGKFEFGGILKTLPLAIFSYTCHSNVLEVYKVNILEII